MSPSISLPKSKGPKLQGLAVAEYVDFFNHPLLHGEIGLVPPAEFETDHWASHPPVPYATAFPAGAGNM